MGETAIVEEQPFYPDRVIKDDAGEITTEIYRATESALILWLLDRAPLGVRVWLSPHRFESATAYCGFTVSKAEVRRNIAHLVQLSPEITLTHGILYIETAVLS